MKLQDGDFPRERKTSPLFSRAHLARVPSLETAALVRTAAGRSLTRPVRGSSPGVNIHRKFTSPLRRSVCMTGARGADRRKAGGRKRKLFLQELFRDIQRKRLQLHIIMQAQEPADDLQISEQNLGLSEITPECELHVYLIHHKIEQLSA